MSKRLATFLGHHVHFTIAAACGLLGYGAALLAGFSAPVLAGGDVFYSVFLVLAIVMAGQKAADLKKRAKTQDEGIVIVVLITLATMAFCCVAVFEVLARKDMEIPVLALAGSGALLGWFVLHVVMAFHYADLFYFEDSGRDTNRDLEFPHCTTPGPWDFLYFSFVIGMTAQVSDVQVRTSVMRRAVLFHGVASFFFNTVFIAMAVNAAVSLAA